MDRLLQKMQFCSWKGMGENVPTGFKNKFDQLLLVTAKKYCSEEHVDCIKIGSGLVVINFLFSV